MADYDVVVVGAGPAGVVTAYLLGRANLKILLIDKEFFPRKKLCAGLLTTKTIGILKDIFNLDLEILFQDGVINYSSDYYRIFYRDKQVYEHQMDSSFFYVYRSVYDNYLLELVKDSGVEVKEGLRVNNLDLENNRLFTVDGQEIRARFIVAADGANSIIRNKLLEQQGDGHRERFYDNMAITMEAIIPREDLNSRLDHPQIYYGVINWGYGWVFPKEDALVIGMGGLKNKNGNISALFQEYLKLLGVNLEKAEYSGWPLPYGNYLRRPVYKNIFLTGDAAGFAEPVTGEGIYYAHKSGALAAKTILQAVKYPGLDMEEFYSNLLAEHIIKRLDKFNRIRGFLCAKPRPLQRFIFSTGLRVFGRQLTKMVQE